MFNDTASVGDVVYQVVAEAAICHWKCWVVKGKRDDTQNKNSMLNNLIVTFKIGGRSAEHCRQESRVAHNHLVHINELQWHPIAV